MFLIDTINFDIHLLALIFIVISIACFILALILRILRLRFLSRLFILFSSLGFLVYGSLFFVNMPSSYFSYADISQIMIFVFGVLLTIYNLIVFIKKR